MLTAPQQRIVEHQQGHARVVAVAGAGKTTTLTHFIASRLASGISPRRIMVLMYNRSAKLDFEEKLQRLLPRQVLPEIRTFHSLGLKIYQRLVQDGHLPSYQEKLLGSGEMEAVVWQLLQQQADAITRQDILAQRKKWVEPALNFIDLVKAGLNTPEQVAKAINLPAECAFFVPVFKQFEKWRKERQRISFADMLYDPVLFLQQNPAVAQKFGGHMQWILVDEYQDINAIQQQLLDIIYAGRGQMMVIGDPDQTIYEFRGSRPEYIVKDFDQRMGDVSVYHLPHSFRYGHELALLANHLISHNREREAILSLAHHSTFHTQIKQHAVYSEAAFAVELIKHELKQRPATDIAVISRIWALCAPIELGLLQAGIPYNLHHSHSVLERHELKIFWILLELASGEFAQLTPTQRHERWLLMLTMPYPKIKRPVLEKMAGDLAHCERDFGAYLLQQLPEELSSWQKQTLSLRADIISDAEHLNMPAYTLLKNYCDQTELLEGVADNTFSAQQADDQVQTIRAFLKFMQEINLPCAPALAFLRQLREQKRHQSGQAGVQLLSIHKSKGLEWPVVIIPGLNSHYYPYQAEGEFATPASHESERRLLYVAMTRAKEQLHLLVPDTEKIKQKKTAEREQPSEFQAELQTAHCQAIAQAIYAQQNSLQLDPRHGSKAAWLERYLEQINQPLTVAMQSALKAKITSWANGEKNIRATKHGKSKVIRYIEHSTLGRGAVEAEDEQYLKAWFDGETTPRVFNKKALAQYLKSTE